VQGNFIILVTFRYAASLSLALLGAKYRFGYGAHHVHKWYGGIHPTVDKVDNNEPPSNQEKPKAIITLAQ
jgi:hypothetical protein